MKSLKAGTPKSLYAETLTAGGAAALAVMINAYWAERGKRAGARVVMARDAGGLGHIYVVKSDTINGLPVQ